MKNSNTIKKSDVVRAFADYKKGKRPDIKFPPKWWHVRHNGKLYGVKIIWRLASGIKDFNTTHARKKLDKLGFEVVDIRDSVDTLYTEAEKLRDEHTLEELEKFAAQAPKKPPPFYTKRKGWCRNRYVVAAVLKRAKGKCEGCKKLAPFKRKTTGRPYLEVHHKKQLSKGGDDTTKNAIALCPNCHRKAHYG